MARKTVTPAKKASPTETAPAAKKTASPAKRPSSNKTAPAVRSTGISGEEAKFQQDRAGGEEDGISGEAKFQQDSTGCEKAQFRKSTRAGCEEGEPQQDSTGCEEGRAARREEIARPGAEKACSATQEEADHCGDAEVLRHTARGVARGTNHLHPTRPTC